MPARSWDRLSSSKRRRYADERVLRDPLSLSRALAVESPADPRRLIQLVGAEPEFLALEALPLGNL